MNLEEVILALKDEIHEMNNNIITLLERDKVQNKRIEDIEEEIKCIKKDQQAYKEHLYKIIGFISCIIFLTPFIMRILSYLSPLIKFSL